MSVMTPILLLSLLFHICTSSPRCPIRLPASSSSSSPRIVNGDPAFSNLSPYLAALQQHSSPFWRTFCTGTLITSSHILTAAHCDVSPSHRVLLNATSTLDPNGIPIGITKVSVHPKWGVSDDGQWDVAVVHLDTSVDIDGMQVNVNGEIPGERAWTRVLGYGVEYEGEIADIERELLQVDVPVVGIGKCKRVYNGVDGVDIDEIVHVCAGYAGGGCDSCQGDSGGPMVQYDKEDMPVLVGVVSSGVGCARAGIPGVYVRIAAVDDWIDRVVGQGWRKSYMNEQVFREKWNTDRIVGVAVTAGVAVVVVVGIAVMWGIRTLRK